MQGGTDHDCGETYREQAGDAIYGVRAWAQGVSWFVVLGGVGAILAGLSQHDTALLANGVTAVVVAFIPRARPAWVREVAKTWAIKQGWAAVPIEEQPLRTPDEILARRVPIRPMVEVCRVDEIPGAEDECDPIRPAPGHRAGQSAGNPGAPDDHARHAGMVDL